MSKALVVVVSLLVLSQPVWAQVLAGPEFRVNTYTTGSQDSPAVGMAPDGRFVIAWESQNIDGSSDAVVGQRYAAPGTAQGANFQVNTYTNDNQQEAAVAVARDGSFVVVWESYDQGSPLNYGVFGQRYDSSGNRRGGEFRLNATYTTDEQGFPSVAFAPDKSFVVVWGSRVPPSGYTDTFAQRFDASGIRLGGEFQVNTYTTGYQHPVSKGPAVAIDAGGNFAVVWLSFDPVGQNQDGSASGVFGQRFNASGARLGGEFQVNTYTTSYQGYATIAMASGTDFSGEFVVVWESYGQDGAGSGAFGQRFSASGTRLGSEFQVNTYSTSNQYNPTVTADAQGNFVVVWGDFPPGDVMARRFARTGNARGAEFRVNTYTPFPQQDPSIASDKVGNFAVAWDSYPQDGSNLGVFGQRFGGLFPRALRVDTTGNNVWEPGESVDVRPTWRNDNGAPQTFNETLGGLMGPAGAVYTLIDGTGDYGTVPTATDRECTDCYQVSVDNPTPRPAQHWDASALQSIFPDTQGQRLRRALHIGASFTDVPTTNGFYRFIETLLHHSITGGCGGTNYCPANSTTRDQMAVFVLVAKEGAGYAPPACVPPNDFLDVPETNPFCRFIEELARRGVVTGCGGGNYCPTAPVTREQMAVFVLRTLDPALSPPNCVPPNLYLDVPETSAFCRWIEELTNRSVVSGCGGGNYCPTNPVTREQMGVFIGGSFSLSLYGP
jgi:hypothetical protein